MLGGVLKHIPLMTALLLGAAGAQTVNLRILETTDLHTSALGYDYYQDKPTGEFGLEYTATLVQNARKEARNSLLFDNGDLIQGNPLGDFVARVNPLAEGQRHPMHAAMAVLGYDAGNLGNHEFNYGLPFLSKVLSAAPMPYVSANVYVDDGDGNPANDKNAFTPYLIQRKLVFDTQGRPYYINVGVIGLLPPQIMAWDKANLDGKVTTRDMVETARKFIPEMKAKGADIVVAIAHSGINADYVPGAENAVTELTKVPGLDVVLSGHSHQEFPGPVYKSIPGADITKGTINGKAVVMAGFWGNDLGIIDLKLNYDRKTQKWSIQDTQSAVRPIWDKTAKKNLVTPDPRIAAAVKQAHEGTLAYVRGKVADLTAPINSYWALTQDDPSVQLVSNAQIAYVKAALSSTKYKDLPVLSAAAPFKAGGRAGASYYTDIPAGTLAIKNVADLYVYPNTVQAVLVTGAQVQEWLERSAGQFKQIDPSKAEPQALVDESFPTYNFDVIDGVTYEIDVTQPNRYNSKGEVANAGAHRIKNLMYMGKPIDPAQEFVVATNNYRASGGGSFPGLTGKNIILQAPDETRQALIGYFNDQKTVNPTADGNWKLTPIPGATLLYTSSPTAQKYMPANATLVKTRDDGFAEYYIKY
ncbi:2',3'-cyclic-nucleotide 2'-phosphodiesterase [Deinococcus arenae]|uniref:2',3'-cyclic-nucleotide 2'-phosphodiesterase n=2 Tax=Deinococcus TaxID=1298 RepID=A0A8H9L7S9_9DEIO|nr:MULTISPECIES: 2',3'-cyclic-nucleotide 2'-phosphodiesterase [Deinococcus]ALW88556.1 2',3'-cyclic-nucleotide 2'-phosphodiesterase [Deinococcus actinosclerus]AWT35303.1 2',3'-cyclic-nucleotide 2'-phosphodiesterase [Deinococcus actinosclerus]GGM35932.1 2',3'-cyclic-nucleotide 2'-phosphodiesterase [Deinococcus arenae]